MTSFKGTDTYVATRELQIAVNAAIHLQKPLIVKGEPGTGKTLLAHEIARALKKRNSDLAYQIYYASSAGPVRIRCRFSFEGFAVGIGKGC